jgi:hypothetical protein
MKKERAWDIALVFIAGLFTIIGGILGAWIQSGGFNPPPEPDIDFLSHSLYDMTNYTNDRCSYSLTITNRGDTLSDDVYIKLNFAYNFTVVFDDISCTHNFEIMENMSDVFGGFVVKIGDIFPNEFVILSFPLQINDLDVGYDEDWILIRGLIVPKEKEEIDISYIPVPVSYAN